MFNEKCCPNSASITEISLEAYHYLILQLLHTKQLELFSHRRHLIGVRYFQAVHQVNSLSLAIIPSTMTRSPVETVSRICFAF